MPFLSTAHLCALLLILGCFYIGRLIKVIPILRFACAGEAEIKPLFIQPKSNDGIHLFVFLGSGGHTGEMLRLLQNHQEVLLNKRYTFYIGYSDDDSKARFLSMVEKYDFKAERIHFYPFAKAREVNAGPIASIVTISKTLLTGFTNVLSIKMKTLGQPHLTLLNGPGTCCIINFWLKLLEWLIYIPYLSNGSNVVYIESLARIESLSLTGKILYLLADVFVVQWEELKVRKAPRSEYYGILV